MSIDIANSPSFPRRTTHFSFAHRVSCAAIAKVAETENCTFDAAGKLATTFMRHTGGKKESGKYVKFCWIVMCACL